MDTGPNLNFKLCAGVVAASVTESLQFLGVLDRFAEAAYHVKLLPRFGVRFRLQLHGECPRSLCINEWQVETSGDKINSCHDNTQTNVQSVVVVND